MYVLVEYNNILRLFIGNELLRILGERCKVLKDYKIIVKKKMIKLLLIDKFFIGILFFY